jgi:hypothetical protein
MRSNEAAILSRVIDAEDGNLSAEAARAMLRMGFPAPDRARADLLAAKAGEGVLTDEEEAELEGYRQVGRLLELMKSKARRSLQRLGASA